MRGFALRAIAALSVATLAGCTDHFVETEPGLSSFVVEVVEAPGAVENPLGSKEEPLPLPLTATRVRIRAEALDDKGQPWPWNGTARVKVTPGTTIPSRFPLRFEAGKAEAEVSVLGVHSETRVWVVDDVDQGERPRYAVGVTPPLFFDQPTLAEANTIPPVPGADNTTSFFVRDGTVGDYVQMDRRGWVFADRQTPDDPCELADPGVTRRDLIVTATTPSGFFVTDLVEPARRANYPGNFAHVFVFNFNYPAGLEPGARLHHLAGSFTEFSGNTQLASPSWRRSRCPQVAGDDEEEVLEAQRALELAALRQLEADAPVIDTAACTAGTNSGVGLEGCGHTNSNLHMESMESGLVRLPEVAMPDMWVRCDFDGSGEVATFASIDGKFGCADPNDAECACNLACQTSKPFAGPGSPFEASHGDKAFDATGKTCAELTGYHGFGQYVVRLVENGVPGPRINLSTRDAVPAYDPVAPENLGARLRARGNLTQVRAARPRWVVTARNDSDLCCLSESACPAGLQLCPSSN